MTTTTPAERLYAAAIDMAEADSDDAVHVADIELGQALAGFVAAGGTEAATRSIMAAGYAVAAARVAVAASLETADR
jgi:hypothetical protein